MAEHATQTVSPPLYYRHTLPVRVMHWVNVLAFSVLLMSGLQIFNAHPALNWGQSSYNGREPVLEMKAMQMSDGRLVGVTSVFGQSFITTGLFGVSPGMNGEPAARGFPSWITVPGPQWLSMARRWHFFFAWLFVINGLTYVLYSVRSRHLARDLLPTAQDRRSIWQSIRDHVRFRHPTGEAAKRYNVLQKIAYLTVIFVLLPMVIIMGWGLSPRLNTVFPGWVSLVGGRQSARTLHFVAAFLLVAFVLVHVFETIISGVWNNVRSMITGNYRVPLGPAEEHQHGN